MRKPLRTVPPHACIPRACTATRKMNRVWVVVLVAVLTLVSMEGVNAQASSSLRSADEPASDGRSLQDSQTSADSDRDPHVHPTPASDNANANNGGALPPAPTQASPNGLPATSLSTDGTIAGGPAPAPAVGNAGAGAAQNPKPSRTPRPPPQVVTVTDAKGTPRPSSSASTAGTASTATSKADMNKLQEIIIVCILGSVATIGLVVTVISRKIYKDTDKDDDDIFAGGVFQSGLSARRKDDSDVSL